MKEDNSQKGTTVPKSDGDGSREADEEAKEEAKEEAEVSKVGRPCRKDARYQEMMLKHQ